MGPFPPHSVLRVAPSAASVRLDKDPSHLRTQVPLKGIGVGPERSCWMETEVAVAGFSLPTRHPVDSSSFQERLASEPMWARPGFKLSSKYLSELG